MCTLQAPLTSRPGILGHHSRAAKADDLKLKDGRAFSFIGFADYYTTEESELVLRATGTTPAQR
jgi:hypothetical protein